MQGIGPPQGCSGATLGGTGGRTMVDIIASLTPVLSLWPLNIDYLTTRL